MTNAKNPKNIKSPSNSTESEVPHTVVNQSRRSWLRGLAVSGVAGAVGAGVGFGVGKVSSNHAAERSIRAAIPCHGDHQAGVTTSAQASLIYVVFNVLAKDKADLNRLFKILTERIEFLTQGGRIAQIDPKLPPVNSGILGNDVYPDMMTITVSVGSRLFDDRYGLKAAKPQFLTEMNPFPNDELDPNFTDGDLSLQICSNTAETSIHALRDIIKNTPDLLSVNWKIDGSLPAHIVQKGKETPRNLLGFKDGTANPDFANDVQLAREVLWVSDHENSASEPTWARGGSYQASRIIRNHVEFWDRTPLQEQEKIIGRNKDSGAPLGKPHEMDEPEFDKDPYGEKIAFKAHIRLANPRTAETRKNLMRRRGYNYSRGISKSGQLDMGLMFIAYQSNLANGFIAVQTKLNGEELEEYIKPIGGGYFFTLPGFKKGEILGQRMLSAGV